MKKPILNRAAWLLLLSGLPLFAQAGTPEQYKALNSWCEAIIHNFSYPNQRIPLPPQPPDSAAYGHYCDAMQSHNKLYTAPKSRLPFHMGELLGNTNYVISSSPNNDPLLPEVYALLARSYLLIKNYSGASSNISKTLALDPRHAAIHVTQAELLLELKQKDKAADVVRMGLALAPEMKALQRLARQLGIATTKASVTPVAPEPPPTTPAVETRVDNPKAPLDQGSSAALPPANIGSPTNPWCRFCPDTAAAPPEPTPSMPGVVPTADR